MTESGMYLRRFEHRCSVCQFVSNHPEGGELLETWLVSGTRPISTIAEMFNVSQAWGDKHKPFTYKKLYVHKMKHLPGGAEIMDAARAKICEAGANFEQAVIETLVILASLKAQGVELIRDGTIRVNNLGDLVKIIETEAKLLGQDRIVVNPTPPDADRPPLIGRDVMEVLGNILLEFVPPDKRLPARIAFDEEVLPLVKRKLTTPID